MNRKEEKNDKKSKTKINNKIKTKEMKQEIGKMEGTEDATKYGEFVASYFSWLTLENQKQKANEMENITKKKV